MRYKVLIYAQNTIYMKDFFLQTSSVLECMSTSDLIPDVFEHIKVFQPHVFLALLGRNNEGLYSLLSDIKKSSEVDLPIAVFGDYNSVEEICKLHPELYDFSLQRPLTSMEAAMMIADYVANNEAKKNQEREEKEYLDSRRSPASNQASAAPAAPAVSATPAKNIAPAPKEEPKPAEPARRRHLLIIDDDRQVLKVLKMGLEADYDVTTMANGKVAEKYLETHTTDLIILDYEMPVINGADVFKHLKGIKNAHNVPVVFLTGVADTSRIMEVMALQPAGYLLKPIDLDRLIETIENILG